jgi:HSP20 family molecular chaperone IbpA
MTENNNSKTSGENSSPIKETKFGCKCMPSSKFLSALIFFILGVCITVFVQNYRERQRAFMLYYPGFYDRNFTEEIRMMEKRIDDILKNHNQYLMTSLNTNQKNDSKVFKSEVFAKQDDNNYCYELNFSGFKKEDVVIDVKNNILTFKMDSKKDSNNNYLSSNFYYSFLVPDYDTSKGPDIVKNDDKIIVKFAKKSKKN